MDELQVHHVTHSPTSVVQIISKTINLINHVVIGLVAVYMTWISAKAEAKPMTWHAWSCTFGYQVLMIEGIMTLLPQNIWSAKYETQTKRTIHWILQTVGSLLALSGMVVEYVNYRGKHFATNHAIVGLISGVFLMIGLCNGCLALWSIELRKMFRPVVLKCLHNFIGVTAVVLGIVSLYYGYEKKFMVRNSNKDVQMALKVVAIVTIIFSLTGPMQSMYRQVKIILFNNSII
ncbi:hypothetical protein HA402_005336 [Bradysia odoriphaga]|nr:hypothetical protein HA402_005336 [Bradysia odoriphaga]